MIKLAAGFLVGAMLGAVAAGGYVNGYLTASEQHVAVLEKAQADLEKSQQALEQKLTKARAVETQVGELKDKIVQLQAAKLAADQTVNNVKDELAQAIKARLKAEQADASAPAVKSR